MAQAPSPEQSTALDRQSEVVIGLEAELLNSVKQAAADKLVIEQVRGDRYAMPNVVSDAATRWRVSEAIAITKLHELIEAHGRMILLIAKES